MRESLELILDLDSAAEPAAWRRAAAKQLGIGVEHVHEVRPRRRSIDARHRPRVLLLSDVWIDEDAPDNPMPSPRYDPVDGKRSVIIVGCGPAGMFAALRLIERGIRPIVLERGKDVQARRRDLAGVTRHGVVDPDSNYCFGEGGAGTYSDGKLYTRSKGRGDIDEVLRVLVAHGAPPDILIDAHPHIGSNRLPRVVSALRETIRAAGGEVRFQTRVVDLIVEDGQARGVITADQQEIRGDAVILATGHSARDIFELLARREIRIVPKAFAMGVRVEHPQPLIDAIQYKSEIRHDALPAASYRVSRTVKDRGVFSFCMCPGGWIVPSATAGDEVVVNGMSLSRRDSPFANSGIVVSVELEDLAPYASHGPLAGMAFQRALETMSAQAGGGKQRAPAQRLTDFVSIRAPQAVPKSSYQPGTTPAPLHELLPTGLSTRLRQGLRAFGHAMRGYLTDEAVVLAVESRTSSPVRIPRHDDTLEHVEVGGLYPCGEGAGYAGGIVSAALDGQRVADACGKVLTCR